MRPDLDQKSFVQLGGSHENMRYCPEGSTPQLLTGEWTRLVKPHTQLQGVAAGIWDFHVVSKYSEVRITGAEQQN